MTACNRCEDVHEAQKCGFTTNECKCNCHSFSYSGTTTGTGDFTVQFDPSITSTTDTTGNCFCINSTAQCEDCKRRAKGCECLILPHGQHIQPSWSAPCRLHGISDKASDKEANDGTTTSDERLW